MKSWVLVKLGENIQGQEKKAQQVGKDVSKKGSLKGNTKEKNRGGEFVTVNRAGCLGVEKAEKKPLGFFKRSRGHLRILQGIFKNQSIKDTRGRRGCCERGEEVLF